MASTSRKIFFDVSFFLAFIDRANLNHKKSVSILEFLARQNYQVYTSSLVILQTFNQIERDMGLGIGFDFLQTILESSIKTLHPADSELLFAYRFCKNNPQRQFSLIEVINARLMEKSGINSILTFDYWRNVAGTTISNLINS